MEKWSYVKTEFNIGECKVWSIKAVIEKAVICMIMVFRAVRLGELSYVIVVATVNYNLAMYE